MPKVTIYTQAYNTKPYIDQCISSVLSQTYTDFEYLLLDNGCTDGSSEILAQYAKKDSRIRLIKFEENRRGQRAALTNKYATGEYYAVLDSDDWWEPDYLERLVGLLECNALDLAVTGTIQHLEATNTDQVMRQLEQLTILTPYQFAENYPALWVFPSTNWASIMKTEIVRTVATLEAGSPKYGYGGDTMTMLQYIKNCSRIGIDNTALYHYRIHPKGVSYQYDPRRFDANIAYYEQIREFLELHKTFDPHKQAWLKRVHLSSMIATLELLRDAGIPLPQKLAECLRILEHPLTEHVLTSNSGERDRWYALMWQLVSLGLADPDAAGRETLARALGLLSPGCGGAFGPGEVGLLAREPALLEAVRAGEQNRLAGLVLGLIAEKRFSKQYDLGAVLHRLVPGSSPLREVGDTRFFRTYAQDCAAILSGDRIAALDHMTELLLEGKRLYAPERFLNIYLSLAALENQAPAFLFGKLRLAEWYLEQGRREDCRAVAAELAGMGLENEAFSALCEKLREGEGQP